MFYSVAKGVILVLSWMFVIGIAGSSACLAKSKPRPYDHTGKLFYHPGEVRSLRNAIEGRTDLYYVEDYICIPGDEHNAPTCRTAGDWYVPTGIPNVPDYLEVLLDDSATPEKPSLVCLNLSSNNNFVCHDIWNAIFMAEATPAPTWVTPTDNSKHTWIFHYRQGKKKDMIEIDFGDQSGLFLPASRRFNLGEH